MPSDALNGLILPLFHAYQNPEDGGTPNPNEKQLVYRQRLSVWQIEELTTVDIPSHPKPTGNVSIVTQRQNANP